MFILPFRSVCPSVCLPNLPACLPALANSETDDSIFTRFKFNNEEIRNA